MEIRKSKMNLFFGDNEIYGVPLFQRDYTWGKEEIDTLMNDLSIFSKKLLIYNNEENYQNFSDYDYFLGTFITQRSKFPKTTYFDYDLIDGQQRLTTFFLIKYALLSLALEKKFIGPDTFKSQKKIIFNRNGNEVEENFKLYNKKNSKFTVKNELYKFMYRADYSDSNYKNNYDLIYLALNKIIKTDTDYYFWTDNVLNNIFVAIIDIDVNQDGGEIFENINFKGKTLNFLDLIKNKLFLLNNKLSRDENLDNSNELFNENEATIEEWISSIVKFSKNNCIFQNNDSLKNQDYILKSILQLTFNKYFNEETIAKNFREFKTILTGENGHANNLNELSIILKKMFSSLNAIKYLNSIMSDVTLQSFYLEALLKKSSAFVTPISAVVLDEFVKGNISVDSFTSKDLNDEETSNLIILIKRFYEIVWKESIATDGFSGINLWLKFADFSEKLSKREFSAVFINLFDVESGEGKTIDDKYDELNKEFKSKFKTDNVYKNDQYLLKHIFLLIENELSNNGKFDESIVNELHKNFVSSKWSIEQIIPKLKNLRTVEWLKVFSQKPEEYSLLINRIGNLTLANKKLTESQNNKPFVNEIHDDKLSIFLETNLQLNKQLEQYKQFTSNEVSERSDWLLEKVEIILNK